MRKKLTATQIKKFCDTVWNHYRSAGRELPWRKTQDPYKILVSEIMLQQTQVDRVLPKYQAFIKNFPTVKALASASFFDVLKLWQGLGYNRRAKFLREVAVVIVKEYHGRFPKIDTELSKLPGIGKYTAAAVCAFAFNQSVILIETNVRQVFLHHFFKNKINVVDTDILPLVAQTLDTNNPREWYWALMDYGSDLKKQFGNINQQSKHYTKQSKFQGSLREVRGKILKLLLEHNRISGQGLIKSHQLDPEKSEDALRQLVRENLIKKTGVSYRLV